MISRYKIDGIEVNKFSMPVITSNMYVIMSDNEALIIDPHVNEEVTELLKKNDIKDITIILTHEHFDHISGVNYFRDNFNVTVWANKQCGDLVVSSDKNLSSFFMTMFLTKSKEERKLAQMIFKEDYVCEVDKTFEGSIDVTFGSLKLHMVETPGHSKGSICIEVNSKYLFSGDSLVQGADIITRLPGGSKKEYQEITRPYLWSLDSHMIVFPGHGLDVYMSDLRIV